MSPRLSPVVPQVSVLRPLLLTALTLSLLLGLAACSSFPEAGPPASDIVKGANGAKKESFNYYAVDVTPDIVAKLRSASAPKLSQVFADGQQAPVQTISYGDIVTISIYEAGSPIFSLSDTSSGTSGGGGGGGGAPPTTTNGGSSSNGGGGGSGGIGGGEMETLPNQQVDASGRITVPYAGRIVAAGLTTSQLEATIEKALHTKVISPQVVVSVVQSQSNLVTVAGDVNHPGRIGLALTGNRILDAISLSGGTIAPASDMALNLTRKNVSRSVRLSALINNSQENIYLQPDDLLILTKAPQTVVMLGATLKDAQISFNQPTLNLAEALGNGNGLADPLADPAGIFVFRFETAEDVRKMLPNANPTAAMVPVVYRLNMKRGSGFFLSQTFPMRDKDVIYVASMPVVQLGKLVVILRDLSFAFQSNTIISN